MVGHRGPGGGCSCHGRGMGIAFLVGAIVAVVFTAVQANKTWGVGAAVGVALGGAVVTLLLPLLALIGCAILFTVARNAHLSAIAAGADEPDALDVGTFTHADPNNPFSPPGHGGDGGTGDGRGPA